MDKFKRAYQEFQQNLTKLRTSLFWFGIGLLFIGFLTILFLLMEELE